MLYNRLLVHVDICKNPRSISIERMVNLPSYRANQVFQRRIEKYSTRDLSGIVRQLPKRQEHGCHAFVRFQGTRAKCVDHPFAVADIIASLAANCVPESLRKSKIARRGIKFSLELRSVCVPLAMRLSSHIDRSYKGRSLATSPLHR